MANMHLPSSLVRLYSQCYSIATAPNIALMSINVYANICLIVYQDKCSSMLPLKVLHLLRKQKKWF